MFLFLCILSWKWQTTAFAVIVHMQAWGLWLDKLETWRPQKPRADWARIRQSAAAIASTSVYFNRFAQYCWHCIVWDESNYCYNCQLCNGCFHISSRGTTINKTKSSQYYRQNCLQCQFSWKSAWENLEFKTLHRWRYCSDIKNSKFHFILIYIDIIVNIGKYFWHDEL